MNYKDDVEWKNKKEELIRSGVLLRNFDDFDNFIMKVYTKYGDLTYTNAVLGTSKLLYGELFSCNARATFREIPNLQTYVSIMKPDMIELMSRTENKTIQIYRWNFVSARYNATSLQVKLKNGTNLKISLKA